MALLNGHTHLNTHERVHVLVRWEPWYGMYGLIYLRLCLASSGVSSLSQAGDCGVRHVSGVSCHGSGLPSDATTDPIRIPQGRGSLAIETCVYLGLGGNA